MSDRDALFAAILAQPDEDTPRLVLADWLDEHGAEGHRRHAELIRAQCELAQLEREAGRGVPLRELLDAARHPTAERRAQLGKTIGRLHEAMWTTRVAQLPVLAGTEWRATLDRGFVGAATFVNGAALVGAGRVAFSATPIRDVGVWALDDFARLAAAEPWLSQVRTLGLYSPLDANEIALLASTGHARGITSVWVPRAGAATVGVLAREEGWSGIEDLAVDNGVGGDHMLQRIAASPLRERLMRLRLSRCRVTADGVRAMASVTWPQLRVLRLPNNEIEGNKAAFVRLGDGGSFPRLKYLDLGTRPV